MLERNGQTRGKIIVPIKKSSKLKKKKGGKGELRKNYWEGKKKKHGDVLRTNGGSRRKKQHTSEGASGARSHDSKS